MSKESSHHADTSTNTYIDPGATTPEAYAISKTSRTLARKVVGNETPEDRVRQRCSVAVGDFAMADLLRFNADPVPATLAALKAAPTSSPISGWCRWVSRRKVTNQKSSVPLTSVVRLPRRKGSQEVLPGLSRLKISWPDSIVVIGNAPSALLTVCGMIREGIRPAVVIGAPVGFVNAAESKAVLRSLDIPSISTEGTRGGTPVAVAAINECITILIGESAP